MLNFVLGLLVGAAVCLLWRLLFGNQPAFKQLIQQELAVNGQLGSLNVLKKRVETLEQKLARLEDNHAVIRQEEPAGERDEKSVVKLLPEPGLTELSSQQPGGNNSGMQMPSFRPNRKAARTEVISLWRTGNTAAQIASRTGLGRGEVELIIALKGRAETG